MKIKKYINIGLIIIIFTVLLLFLHKGDNEDTVFKKTVNPSKKSIFSTVLTTGIVQPQNRLEIKPSISGRIEEILVSEGDKIKAGDILAWMSSTERAALVDAAISQGDEILEYWQEVYKKTPIISPINGEVIVRIVEPGQTVLSSEVVLVLSDRLIINAQFDETDIGKVKKKQKALITLDAYPDITINGVVDHIAYESQMINNVTIYEVDILPSEVPEILRSGMSVSVKVIEKTSEDTITIPSNAVKFDEQKPYVFIEDKSGKVVQQNVSIGLVNDTSTEIVSGLSLDDKVIIEGKTLLPQRNTTGSNPFMHSRKKK